MKKIIMNSFAVTICLSSFAHADFQSSRQDLNRILSALSVESEIGKSGDLVTIHRIQAGDNFGYQLVTSDGCSVNALVEIRTGDVIVFPKRCSGNI